MSLFIHQIYYDDQTYRMIQPGFIPLNNSNSPHPSWFEFWPILNYLRNTTLQENSWYGFLSPSFPLKTAFSSEFVINFIRRHASHSDVALFSSGWDQLCYYLNPFEQGDVWHPGLLSASQQFIDQYRPGINLHTMVSDLSSSVFSNYIVAQREFWIQWRDMAEQYFNFVEHNIEHQSMTSYGSVDNRFPLKTFIQERFPTLILSTGAYNVVFPDQSIDAPIFSRLFANNDNTRRLLRICNLLKNHYREMHDDKYLELYWKIRNDIQFLGI